jgi:hypothetical protein
MFNVSLGFAAFTKAAGRLKECLMYQHFFAIHDIQTLLWLLYTATLQVIDGVSHFRALTFPCGPSS